MSNYEWFSRQTCMNQKYKSVTNVKKKEKLLTPDFTLIFIQCIMKTLLHRKDELVAVHYKCSKNLLSK